MKMRSLGEMAMAFALKRAYDPPEAGDGFRVLVDRLWPRGVRREALAVDAWLKDVAPSNALRQWLHEDVSRFSAFAEQYRGELRADEAHQKAVGQLLVWADTHPRVTLVYAARDPVHNHARVLLEYLQSLDA